MPLVEAELKKGYLSMARLKAAVKTGKVKIKMPESKFLDEVKRCSERVGDSLFLSEADKQVLALALELKSHGRKPVIVTDDYSIQNLANSMGIEFKSLSTFGIRFRYLWTLYCPACKREYSPKQRIEFCKVCGTKLKFKHTKEKYIKEE